MIAIVDYGLGNVQAIANIYKRLDVPAALVRTAAELSAATKIILPGVGAFDWAMQRLNDSGMRETLDRKATADATPVLGICVGMQILAAASEEGRLPGLGWIPGSVRRFDAASMADWRGARSATPNERGISRHLMARMAAGAGFALEGSPVPIVFEPINKLLKRTIGFRAVPFVLLHAFDRAVSRVLALNDHYWRDTWFKKLWPSSYHYVFRKPVE